MSEAKQVKVRRVPVMIDGTEYVWVHVDGETRIELHRLKDDHNFGYVEIETVTHRVGGKNVPHNKTIACCSVGNNRPIRCDGIVVGNAVDDVERRVEHFSVQNRTAKERSESHSVALSDYLDNRISYREAKDGERG